MMYLLDAAEMAEVHAEREAARKMPNLEGLTNVVQYVVTQMSENGNRLANGRRPSLEPHGCIHVKDARGTPYQTRYCDYCPVAGICPQPKDYSK